MSSLALSNLTHDPVLRELVERRRLGEKRDAAAAELRVGHAARLADLDEAAAEYVRQSNARRPTTSAAGDVKVSTDDLDADLVGASGLAYAYSDRLSAAISSGMEAGYGDFVARVDPETRAALLARDDVDPRTRRRFGDRSRVVGEVGTPKGYAPPPKPEPKRELTGSALIEEEAREFLALLDRPKRTRRR